MLMFNSLNGAAVCVCAPAVCEYSLNLGYNELTDACMPALSEALKSASLKELVSAHNFCTQFCSAPPSARGHSEFLIACPCAEPLLQQDW